jgi:hypothetical protein
MMYWKSGDEPSRASLGDRVVKSSSSDAVGLAEGGDIVSVPAVGVGPLTFDDSETLMQDIEVLGRTLVQTSYIVR